jgi:multiple sugar transport system substrate-binding protein
MKSKWAAIALSMAVLTPVLAACTKQQGEDPNQHRVLRIATMYYGGNDDYFRTQFSQVFEFANPNIELEIVSAMDDSAYRYGTVKPGEKPADPYEKLKEIMQGDNPPDVVMVDYNQLPDLIANNLLTQLDPYITKDKFDTSDIVPAVLDGLKKLGDNKLYALAPTFSSSALIYNKTMFQEAGVEFPTDKMTWDQAFDLARRLSRGEGEDRKYGFGFSTQAGMDWYYSMMNYAAPLGLKMFDDDYSKMTVDTVQWENVWKTMVQLKKDQIIPPPPDFSNAKARMASGSFNPFQYDDFLSGRVAMAVINYGQINEIVNANKNADRIEGFKPINWDVVTVPVHPEAPDVGGYMNLDGVMGINAKAQNVEDAWKFIKFVNGPDWARLKSHSNYQMVSRKSYIKPPEGLDFNIQAFYTLTPAPNNESRYYQEMRNLYPQLQQIGRNLLQNVMDGSKEVREALKEWQTQGDAAIQQWKQNPDAPINLGPAPLG